MLLKIELCISDMQTEFSVDIASCWIMINFHNLSNNIFSNKNKYFVYILYHSVYTSEIP
jgi:hypothetical protein